MACWNKTKVHVAGASIVVCTKRDCRLLVVPFGLTCRCVSVERHRLCFFQFTSERRVSRNGVRYLVSSGSEVVSPLAPVVVVGEGQVNLVYGRRLRAMAKVSKALWLIDFDEPNQSPPVTTVTVVVSGLA